MSNSQGAPRIKLADLSVLPAHRSYVIDGCSCEFFSPFWASVSSVNGDNHAQLTGPNELIFILLLYVDIGP